LAWQVYCFSSPPRRLCFWANGTDSKYNPCVCFPKLVLRDDGRFSDLYSLETQDLTGLAVGEYLIEIRRIHCSKSIAGD
jgi:hypothetical protein